MEDNLLNRQGNRVAAVSSSSKETIGKKKTKGCQVENSEAYRFRTQTDFKAITMYISGEAAEWLGGYTKNVDGALVSHHVLYADLLSRMKTREPECVLQTEEHNTHRLQQLRIGQAQYSELQLQQDWRIGRKVIRRLLAEMDTVGLIRLSKSTIASVMTFPAVWSLRTTDNHLIKNPR